MMVTAESARDPSLDLLRAAATLYVVGFWHLSEYATAPHLRNPYTAFLGTCALGVFVFLSALLLSRRYSVRCLPDVRRFYVRRLVRIYPMYVLTLLGSAAAGLIWKRQAVKGMLGLNVLTGTPTLTLWFVEMLCIFHLITPLMLYRYSVAKTAFMGAALSCAFWLASGFSHGRVDIRLAQYVVIFAAGIIAGRCARAERLLTGGLAAACSVSALPVLWWVSQRVSGAAAVVLFQCAIMAFLPAAFFSTTCLASRLSPTLIANIAYASYAAYLIHWLTAAVATCVYARSGLLPSLTFLYVVWLPATYALAWVLQRRYDLLCNAIAARHHQGQR
jgi:peptidoglycan/LPS O-acetylase OafA/YrhL